MTNDKPDWLRLHKALAIEVEQGFTDLVGKQYRFSEFLTLTFGKFPTTLPSIERRRWQELAAQFAGYSNLVLEDRQNLVALTRSYLHELQQVTESRGDKGDKGDEGDEGDEGDKGNKGNKGAILTTFSPSPSSPSSPSSSSSPYSPLPKSTKNLASYQK